MSMRKQFVQTLEPLLNENKKLSILLGDIGVFGFKKAAQNHPDRVYNIGILEQATISLAAGMAKTGLIPVVHTIAPFLVERAFEQLKDDFCYQKLGGNFVSVGASYDYAALGCTHHCPGDIEIMKSIPGMEVVVPGTAAEFDSLFRQAYSNGHPTYFRLSERENAESYPVQFGKAHLVKKGSQATVIAIGPTLKNVLEATQGLDVTVLYYTTIAPFDSAALQENSKSSRIILIEPGYEGSLAREVSKAMGRTRFSLDSIGVPREFLTKYGKAEEHDQAIGMTATAIRTRIEANLPKSHLPQTERELLQ